jgi:hypothetical protein
MNQGKAARPRVYTYGTDLCVRAYLVYHDIALTATGLEGGSQQIGKRNVRG